MSTPAKVEPQEISTRLLGLFLVILVVATFGLTLFGGLVFDDRFIIVDNAYLPDPAEWSKFFTESSWAGSGGDASNYRALPLLSFGLNYLVGGLRAFDYHLVNLLFHIGNVLLLFALAQRMGLSKNSAWLASALFAVHPLQTEPVAEIVGRMDLMAATGVLAALICHYNGRVSSSQQSRLGWFSGAALCYALALWSKEHAILFPLVAVAVDLLVLQRPKKAWVLPYMAYWAVAGLYLAVWFSLFQVSAMAPAGEQVLSNPLQEADGPLRFVSAVWVAGLYLWHWIWPANLSPDYCYSQIMPLDSLASVQALLAIFGAALFALLGVWIGRRYRVGGVGLALAVAMFLPVSNLFFPIGTVMGDRLFYLPIAGLSLLVGAIGDKLGHGVTKKRFSTVFTVIIALLVILSIRQSQVWKTDFTVDQRIVEAAPLCARGHNNLGYDLLDRGAVDAAEQSFLTAVGIYSPYPQAQAGIARIAYARHDWASTLKGAEHVLTIAPEYAAMMHLAASAARQQGDLEVADRYWRQALELEPDDTLALDNLAILTWSNDEPTEAIALWSRAIEVPGVPPTVIFNLARAHEELGQTSEALSTYQHFLQRSEQEPVDPGAVSVARERVTALSSQTVPR